MRIEKIELIGFKSFADKTAFNLHPGITCIVGPNGCGKSNIVDAFRWVLGEQSAKSLRGEKMEEVIFNGSSSKKPKGMAEVTMVISGLIGTIQDNGDGPQDAVTITRRLYRSGESEYMINRQTCRLKDIRDVFLDTGLDFKSYSILEQGRIGAILNSKPLERRFIIEEVAGVMKYKVRKAEALSKLESSRLNLARINDIISEVKKQINILDRLAKKAERYKKLQSELHAIELKVARREYQQLKDSLAEINEEYSVLRGKEAIAGAEITTIENKTSSRRILLIEKEKSLEIVHKNFQTVERDIAEINQLAAISRQDISNLEELKEKLMKQEEEAAQKISDLLSKCTELGAAGARMSEELEVSASVLREKNEELRTIEESLQEKEDAIEEERRAIFRISDEISSMRNEVGRHQASEEALEKREAFSLKESEDSRNALQELESAIASAESEIFSRNNEARMLKEKKEMLERELSSSKAGLEDLTRILAEAREELASSVSRFDSLREIVFDKPTRELLASNVNVRLLATISDIFDVAAEYEKAIESALSEKSDSLIVESFEDIQNAVSSLKGKGLDKTAFITISPMPISMSSELPDGIIGTALDFVSVREGFEKVARNLLGNILIVKDLKQALDCRPLASGYLFATIEGEILDQSNVVIVGGEKGIFRRKREIRELELAISEKRAAVEAMTVGIKTAQERIQDKEDLMKNVEASLNTFEKDVSLSRLTVQNYMEDKDRISRKLSYLTIELEDMARERRSAGSLILNAENEIQKLEAKKASVEAELLDIQSGISDKKEEIGKFRSDVTEIRLQAASYKERLEAVRNEIDSSEKDIEDLKKKKDEAKDEIASVISRVMQRKEDISSHELKLKSLVAEADGLNRNISEKREEIDKENSDLIVVDHELKALRQQASAVTSRIAELDVSRAEHKLKIENLSENVLNNYGADLKEIELAEVSPEEEEKLVDLRNKIQEIGPVNLGTLDEYEELRTRYEFMSIQQEDLTKSIAELEEAITKINSTTRKKLRDAFDALRVKFADVFVTLFGGGKAELVLTDEHNILETGIDIVAQPPGKKIQNIHLLSGGEQALTALALQFASFLIKPTPLCVLDEADAPLDESNTERYSRMLQGLSQDTQFIVVTHNRTTMGVAQHLYGITMEEAGVSKVISMQFAEV